MHPPIHSVSHPDLLPLWLAMVGFGAYHGLNPGMGWLFALALGLQQRSERAIWTSLLPIAAGHAASILIVAALLLALGTLIPMGTLRLLTAVTLLGFGVFKLLTYYRHPRWVGMKVGNRDLFLWSLLMAFAHGAGLMVAPILVNLAGLLDSAGMGMTMAVLLHTFAMLIVMACIAWVVYRKLGLAILRTSWVNFDLIWAGALLVVGGVALAHAI